MFMSDLFPLLELNLQPIYQIDYPKTNFENIKIVRCNDGVIVIIDILIMHVCVYTCKQK